MIRYLAWFCIAIALSLLFTYLMHEEFDMFINVSVSAFFAFWLLFFCVLFELAGNFTEGETEGLKFIKGLYGKLKAKM